MPELPDVETFKRYFNATSLHQRIARVTVCAPDILEGVSVRKLKRRLKGREFESTKRHGKYLFVRLDQGSWLVMHFGMTGFLKYFKDTDKKPCHTRLLLGFANRYNLAYDCQRKLGMVSLADSEADFIERKELGPDPMHSAFDFFAFEETVASTKGMIKSVLMNQQVLAGIGNVYSDEILFQAGVHPRRSVGRLDEKTLKKLFRKMQEVLRTTIDRRAQPERFPRSYLTPHRRKDGRCPKCHGELDRLKVSGRTAYYCPRCQDGNS